MTGKIDHKFDFLNQYWKKNLIKHNIPKVSLQDVRIGDIGKDVLTKLGLPLVWDSFENLIPFSHITSLPFNGENYYIIGDNSKHNFGVSFLAIKEDSEEVYLYSKGLNNNNDIDFLNTNLLSYLIFFTKYLNFFIKNSKREKIDGKILEQEFNTLVSELKEEDPIVFSNIENYWYDIIEYNRGIDFAEYF